MKKLLLAIALIIGVGFVGNLQAGSGWVTFTSTNVCISTGANLELLRILHSTGSTALSDSFLVVVDSNPRAAVNDGCDGNQTDGMDYTPAAFPAAQHIVPPIVMWSTNTASTNGNLLGVVDLRYPDGSGRPIKNGLAVFKLGTNAGTYISVEYRRKR